MLWDLLLSVATTDLFRWTDRIENEWMNAVLYERPESAASLPRTRQLMEDAVPDAVVTGYEAAERM